MMERGIYMVDRDEDWRHAQTVQFKKWVLAQESPDYKLYLSKKDENVIVIETDYCHGEVSFYPMDIIQLSVVSKSTEDHLFYLHFQMHTLDHAMGLFEEMIESIQNAAHNTTVHILLCCTSGLTTGYFAERLNDSSKLLSLNYEFTAVPYGELYRVASKYDIILLAPQISYIHDTAQKILTNKTVLKIPAKVFAAYDVRQLFTEIDTYLNPPVPDKKEVSHEIAAYKPLPLKRQIQIKSKILTITLIREDFYQFHFASRVYDTDVSILMDEDVIKHRFSLSDIYDICDTAFARYPDIEMIGFAMPGIINRGRVTLTQLGLNDVDIIDSLTKKYSRTFILYNDANAIVLGYYASQEKYNSISLLFQPYVGSAGGVGSIHEGRLIEGREHVAGEVQYLPSNKDRDPSILCKTPEGTLEWCARTVTSIISILGPDVFLLCSPLIIRADSLRREIEKYIPKRYIPEIVLIDNLREYMLLGQLILCTQAMENNP